MVEISELGVAQAAQAIRDGELTAEDLAEALLARCAASKLNAFISLEPGRVRAAAVRADEQRRRGERMGPLHGVPLALKDNFDTADFPTTAGTPGLAANRPAHNATVVQRLLDAGALILGKANMQELAFGPTSNNAAFGPVHNPYDRRLIPGGSSGGTGAAVAARLSPAGLGTDTGGSVRIPAALCGCVGFRPTTKRYSQAGIVPISSTRDTAGPMTRSVADVVLLDGVITGGPTRLPPTRLEGLRLGVPREYFYADLDPQLAEVVEAELVRLRGLGVVLVEADVPRLKELDEAASFPVALHETITTLREYLRDAGTGLTIEALFDRIGSPDVKGFVTSLLGDGAVPDAVYKEAIAVHRPALQAALEGYFQRHDVAAIVFPTTPMPARPIGDDDTVEVAGRRVPTFFTYIRNTDPASNAALPGLSLPVGLTRDGLPVGIELDAPSGRDHALLAIGLAYEAS